jgi:hypothetical protein
MFQLYRITLRGQIFSEYIAINLASVQFDLLRKMTSHRQHICHDRVDDDRLRLKTKNEATDAKSNSKIVGFFQ